MKTPLSYYGGKQRMLAHILPLIPADVQLYNEPCVGGGAVFWGKDPSPVEVINDVNLEIVNFYEVLATRCEELLALAAATLHSREQHRFANIVYQNPCFFDPARRAWAVWVLATESFASKLNGAWGYSRVPSERGTDTTVLKTTNKKLLLAQELEPGVLAMKKRLERVQIECSDALRVIESRDFAGAFHYVDPPYFNSDCGHYKGYSAADFDELLDTLSGVKGRFLLSCYDSQAMRQAAARNGWKVEGVEKPLTASKAEPGGKRRTKTECLVRNFA